jgi:putative tricarboxylic transport membrane protein
VLMKKSDQWSGLFLSILAIFMCWGSLSLPYGSIHNPGPGFFPLWLGVILGLMSMGLMVTITLQKETARSVRDILAEEIRWKEVLQVIIGLVLYGVLIDYLGYLLVTFLLMALLLRSVEPQPWKAVVGWALGGTLGSYLIFEVWMKLRLPRGILGI